MFLPRSHKRFDAGLAIAHDRARRMPRRRRGGMLEPPAIARCHEDSSIDAAERLRVGVLDFGPLRHARLLLLAIVISLSLQRNHSRERPRPSYTAFSVITLSIAMSCGCIGISGNSWHSNARPTSGVSGRACSSNLS